MNSLGSFKLYPALDLLNGRCVRLSQGKFDQVTEYGSDPLEVMQNFIRSGAEALHVVDLEGARNPQERQLGLLKSILRSSSVPVQVGGGIRSFADAETLLELGADRVVVGSLAVQNVVETRKIFDRFGTSRVTLALDVWCTGDSEPKVALHGWTQESRLTVSEVLNQYKDYSIPFLLCTDITRDGMLSGPNISLYQSINRSIEKQHLSDADTAIQKSEVQASGGIKSLDDLRDLRRSGVRAAILGRSIYEGTISLPEAIREMSAPPC